jgi:ABC-type branched-subunit amino acid transport system ATPase component
MTILQVRGLVKHFGGLPAVDGVDLDVEERQVFAIIGPNGAGKSTLLKLISGMLEPSSVDVIRVGETDLVGRKPHQVRHAGVAKVLQTPRVFESMTVLENAALGAMFGRMTGRASEREARATAHDYLDMLGLGGRAESDVGQLNLHEKRLLDLVRALCGQPRVLLLDEVMAGLNPSELEDFIGVIRRLRDELGLTVVWVEHVMKAIRALADHVFVLNFGRELAQGPVDEVMRHPKVVEAYLGRRGSDHAQG